MDYSFYKGKRVFITGHTGFKGSWLALWLNRLSAEVMGYALPPQTSPALFEVSNLRGRQTDVFASTLDADRLNRAMREFKPEIVLHLAAQPIVRLSYAEPALTYQVNVIGALNVMEPARQAGTVKT
jgi:CDP-glucose 4,6-dehydratase